MKQGEFFLGNAAKWASLVFARLPEQGPEWREPTRREGEQESRDPVCTIMFQAGERCR